MPTHQVHQALHSHRDRHQRHLPGIPASSHLPLSPPQPRLTTMSSSLTSLHNHLPSTVYRISSPACWRVGTSSHRLPAAVVTTFPNSTLWIRWATYPFSPQNLYHYPISSKRLTSRTKPPVPHILLQHPLHLSNHPHCASQPCLANRSFHQLHPCSLQSPSRFRRYVSRLFTSSTNESAIPTYPFRQASWSAIIPGARRASVPNVTVQIRGSSFTSPPPLPSALASSYGLTLSPGFALSSSARYPLSEHPDLFSPTYHLGRICHTCPI